MRKAGVLIITLALVAVAWTSGVTANTETDARERTEGAVQVAEATLDTVGLETPLPAVAQKDLWALERGMTPNTIAVAASGDDPMAALPPNARCVARQDDAGSGTDAGNDADGALTVEPGNHTGCVGAHDTEDWYRVTGGVTSVLNVTLVPPENADYDLYVTDCSGATLGQGTNPRGETDRAHVGFDHRGALCVRVHDYLGTGPYNLTLERGNALCGQDDAGSQRDSNYGGYSNRYDADWPGRVDLDDYGAYDACYRYDADLPKTWELYLDEDGYRFNATAGETIILTMERQNCEYHSLSVYDTDGWWRAYDSNSGDHCDTLLRDGFVPPYTGTYILNTRGRHGGYDITLDLGAAWCTPQDDAGTGADAGNSLDNATAIPDGAYAGCLDQLDPVDVYDLPANAGDHVTVDVTLPGYDTPDGDRYAIAYLYDSAWNLRAATSNWNAGDANTTVNRSLSTFVGEDTTLHLLFAAGLLGADYAFDVTRDTGLPVTPLHVVNTTLTRPGAMAVCDGDLLVASWGAVHEVTDDGLEVRVDAPYQDYYTSLACDGNGDLYSRVNAYDVYDEWTYHALGRITGPDAGHPVLPGGDDILFTPDGHVIVNDAPDPVRYDCATRAPTPMTDVSSASDLAHGPDGTLYATQGNRVIAIAGHNNTTVVAEFSETVDGLAFDALGRGYASTGYYDGTVYRFDPATGDVTPIATGAWGASNLQFHGTRLYMSQYGWYPAYGNMVGYYDVGVPGVEGHQPHCDLPWADLAITAVEEEPATPLVLFGVDTGQTYRREYRVNVTNLGPSDFAGRANVRGYESTPNCRWPAGTLGCEEGTYFASGIIRDGLAVGNTTTVTLIWSSLLDVGDHELTFVIEPSWPNSGEGEANPDNNEATVRTHAYVEGYGGFL